MSNYPEEDFAQRRARPDADLVLGPGEYAYVQDGTKGVVQVYVGPQKNTISQTDRPVVWSPSLRRYMRSDQEKVVQVFPSAAEGSYIVLSSPVPESFAEKSPSVGKISSHVILQEGRRVNIPGPATFPLWPGQSAEVLEGHSLRSNQYLLVKVYNDEEAQKNWGKGVVKPQSSDDPEAEAVVAVPEKVTMGQLVVIKGTDVSFYIPPTGVEVVSEGGTYVRQAVTLERLEYCILLDESGDKRYVHGPDVVFPKPTETFVQSDDGKTRKFRAIELNEIQGIYVKVIADHEEGEKKFKTGDELFITGKEQSIYYPRPEHSIIKYGDQTKHYAVAIPSGQGRYVLDRLSGSVDLVEGPRMFLPDPRTQVIVTRALSDRQVALWFSGNEEASSVNRALRVTAETSGSRYLDSSSADDAIRSTVMSTSSPTVRSSLGEVSSPAMAESFQRGTQYRRPRTVTLDGKYDGSVKLNIWPGTAVMIVDETGGRRVVVGPSPVHLKYDETLLELNLSTGKPKNTDILYSTVYLKVRNNTVSDIIDVQTRDLVDATVKVSYKVNFEGEDRELWFEVDNYVKFMCDHMRSLLKSRVKQVGVEEFYQDATSIVRDCLLGEKLAEGQQRPGRSFPENGMRTYDVEVLKVELLDKTVEELLRSSNESNLTVDLQLSIEAKRVEGVVKGEALKRSELDALEETSVKRHGIAEFTALREHHLKLDEILKESERLKEALMRQLDRQEELGAISEAELLRDKAEADQKFGDFKRRLEAESQAIREQVESVSDKLSEGLILASHASLAERISTDLAPLVSIGGGDVEKMWNNLLKGTFLQDVLSKTRNGHATVGA